MTDPPPLVVSPDIEIQRTLELLRRPLKEVGRIGPFRFVVTDVNNQEKEKRDE